MTIKKNTVPELRFPGFEEAWEVTSIQRSLTKVIDYRGKAPPKSDIGIPLITARNVRDGCLDFTADEYIDEQQYDSWMRRGVPKANDILFTTEAPLGNVAIFPSTGRYALGQRIITLQTDSSRCNTLYLFQLLRSQSAQKAIDSKSTGTTAKGIKSKVFVQIRLGFPTLPEQRKIAEFLTAVDQRIEQLDRKKALLEEYKKGVIQQLFSQTLRFKDDQGNDFPDWEEKELGDSIDLLSGFPFASEDILDGQTTQDRERVLLMRGVNITEGSIRHSEDQDRFYCGDVAKLQKYRLEVGDMVIGMDGSKVGKNSALIGEAERGALLVQRVARIRALNGTSLQFIYQHINSPLFHRYVDQVKTSSGIPHISATQIREFTIRFPCLEEQNKIANFLTAIDSRINAVTLQITLTQTYKKGLLQQMFV